MSPGEAEDDDHDDQHSVGPFHPLRFQENEIIKLFFSLSLTKEQYLALASFFSQGPML
jgi:hypothetical protein